MSLRDKIRRYRATPTKTPRPPISAEDRERIGLQYQVFAEYAAKHRQGTPFRLTLAECKAEARHRLGKREKARAERQQIVASEDQPE